MPIDGLLFTALSRELHERLRNARIQGVYQPSPGEVLLQLRQPGQTHRLLISAHPKLARIHLTEADPDNPLSPPPFCLLLRKHLIPGRVLRVEQPPFERSLQLVVEGYGETGERVERALVVEVMGRYSNVILVDRASGSILDALKRVPGEVNRHREILPNRAYVPPPPQDKIDPSAMDYEAFDLIVRHAPAECRLDKVLHQNFMGLGPFAAGEILAGAGLPPNALRTEMETEDVPAVWQSFSDLIHRLDAGDWTPTAVTAGECDTFWCFPIRTVSGGSRVFESVQDLMDWSFRRLVEREKSAHVKQRLNSAVEQHLRRVNKKAALQQEATAAGDRAGEFKLHGDLITANLYHLNSLDPGTSQVTLANYFDDQRPVTIKLDPHLTPNENAQSCYRRYRKAKKTRTQAARQLDRTLSEQRYLDSVETTLSLTDTLAELEEIEEELVRQGYLKLKGQTPQRGGAGKTPKASEPLRWKSADGFSVLVGRNNRQNDHVTMSVARPHDLWLHVKEIPGAHVVIQTNGASVPDTTLLEAAHLAVLHSKARHSGNVPVDYTHCRHVRKPRGAKPGMVIYDHQRTLYVTPDPEGRILLRAGGPASPS